MMSASPSGVTSDQAWPMRGFLALEAFVRVVLWNTAFAWTAVVLTKCNGWPEHSVINADIPTAMRWGGLLFRFAIIYNVIYLLILIVLRALVPSPREGTYWLTPDKLDRGAIARFTLVGILVKARYQAPFPAFLVFHLANLPPFCWLMDRVFGPHSKSVLVLDPILPDSHLLHIGRNVTVGNMTSIVGHTHYGDHVDVRRTVIEDDVMIGAHALIYGGCTIKRGAIVYGGSIVRPNTVIGEYEAWGGVPARKLKDVPPPHV